MTARRRPRNAWLSGGLAVWFLAGATWAAEPAAPVFLGELSCSSSSCHGGAKGGLDQYTAWKQHDVHTRAHATLTTPRSQRIAELLKIGPPTAAARCTACHAPFQEVAVAAREAKVRPEVGVSCESCHGAASAWLRSHTRLDYTHADRVAAGLRDLKDPYQRANTCVACHQHLEADLRHAGHPPLIFELDGQCVTQPRHWRESSRQGGGQMWLVGQAVALREMSWHLERATNREPASVARWQALVWLLHRATSAATNLPSFVAPPAEPAPADFQRIRQRSDTLAREAAAMVWPALLNERLFRQLTGAAGDFAEGGVSREIQACRAERLVLGLDRLFIALDKKPAGIDAQLQGLFNAVQSLPDFDVAAFAGRLKKVSDSVTP